MKKISLITFLALFGPMAFAQNVGIGTNNPQTKLQVTGAISSTPISAAAADNVTIPNNTSVFRLTLVSSGTQINALSMVAPAEGQYLSIYNTDDNDASFSGQIISATTGVASFNYINGGWRTVSNTKAGGDLSGTYPAPLVVKIQGKAVSATAPGNGDVLKYNTTTQQYEPSPDLNSGGTVGTVTASSPLNSSGGSNPNISLTGTIPVLNGGTGLTAIGAGQVLVGTSSGTFLNTTLTGTANQVNVSSVSGGVTLSTPQSIATSSSPSFNKVTATGANINSIEAIGSVKVGATSAAAATAGAGAIKTNGANLEYSDGANWKTLSTGGTVTTVTGTAPIISSGGSAPAISLASTGTAGTYTKVTTDAYGRVSSGGSLATGDIPNLSGTYVDLATNQTAAGNKTWSGAASFTAAGSGLNVSNTGTFGNSVSIGPKGSYFGSDQGGNIELGADNGTANTGSAVPYIDFHYGTGAAQDFNVRLQNDADGQLAIIGNARVSALSTAGIVTNSASGVLSTTTSVPVGNLPDATTLAKGIVQLAGDLSGTATSPQIAAGAIVNADINAAAAIADTKLATISTAGKVSNTATTATNANTASAIVARDASGNFSAGTITAALSGNATSATNIAGGSAGKVPYQTAAGTTTFTATSPSAAGQYLRSTGANTWDASAIQAGDLPATISGAWTRTAPYVSLVTSTDKVGIGTSTASAKLHVYEATILGNTPGNSQLLSRISGNVTNTFMKSEWLYRDASSSTGWQTTRWHDGISVDASFLTPGTDTRVWWERDPNDNIQSWGNDNVTYMTLSSGNLGIGITGPGFPLTVRTTTVTANTIVASLANAIGDANFQLNAAKGAATNNGGDVTTVLGQSYNGAAISEGLRFHRGGGASDGAMSFTTSATEKIRITNAGNMGIGTTNPPNKLSVVGTASVGDASSNGSRLLFSADASSATINYNNNGPLITQVNGSERMRIDAAGILSMNSNNSQGYPPYNSGGGFATQWNFSGGQGEVDIWNNCSAGSPRGFSFRQMTSATASTELLRLNDNGIFGKFRDVTYHNFNIPSGGYTANNGYVWFPAAGSETANDNVMAASPAALIAQSTLMPYSGRIVAVLIRVDYDSNPNEEIKGRLAVDVNGSISISSVGVNLSQGGSGTYVLPVTGYSFSRLDRVSVGVNLVNNAACNSGTCWVEDDNFWVTIIWEYNIQD